MPAIINYKICDLAQECGGFEVCPTGAFFWNQKTKRPEIDIKKCISCGACAKTCPINAILVAETEEEYQKLAEQIKNDPRSEKELWRERLGTQPGRTPPSAKVITPENFNEEILQTKGLVALDVWSEKTLNCRYHSVLWDDLEVNDRIVFKKLDGGKFPKLASKLRVNKLPTFLVFFDGLEKTRYEGYLYYGELHSLKEKLNDLIKCFS